MVVKWTVRKTRLPDTHYARVNNGVNFTWAFVSCDVVGSSDGYSVGEIVDFKRGLGATSAHQTHIQALIHLFLNNPGGTMTFSGQRYKVTDVDRREV